MTHEFLGLFFFEIFVGFETFILTIYFSVNAKTVRVPIAKHLANPHVNQKKNVAKNRS